MSFSKTFQLTFLFTLISYLALLPAIGHAAEEAKSENKLERAFFEALSFIGDDQFPRASEKFVQLKALALQRGFENLSGFSLTLLENTEVYLSKHQLEKAGFLLRWAKDLSPEDARVLLGVARFSELLGFRERLSIGLHGIWIGMFSPVVATTIAVNSMLLGLTSLTLALLFVCVLQFARRGNLLFQVVSKYLPVNARGAFAPLAVFALLVLPALLGVLFALVCWSLVLAKVFTPGKKLAACAGILTLIWGLALPVLNVSLGNSASKLAWVLEGQRIRSFIPHGSQYLSEVSKKNSDGIVKFGAAQSLLLEGRVEEAKRSYSEILRPLNPESSFGRTVRFHLASLELAQQNFPLAREELEKLEPQLSNSFELAYNMSLVNLGQLDTEGQRKYYERARELDSSRLARLEINASERPFPLLPGAPWGQYIPYLLKLHDLKEQRPAEKPFGRAGQVASALVVGSSPALLVVLGICVFVCSLLARPAFPNFENQRPDAKSLWRLVPGGEFFAGQAPTKGAIILAIFLALILAATQTPIHLVPIVPLSRSAAPLFFMTSGLVFLLSLAWATLASKFRRER